MVFTPGDPWPDQTYPGGAVSPGWSGYVRLVVQAQIAAGAAFTMGAHPQDKLNAGFVMSEPNLFPLAVTPGQSGLWVDLTCDLVDLQLELGAHASQGILTKTDAGTLTATLSDPEAKYDPLNPSGPYALGSTTRLIPGVAIRAFVEVIDSVWTPTVWRYALFTGTADSWSTTWEQWPAARMAKLVATDTTKQFVKMDREEQPPQGAQDLIITRLQRIIDFHEANVQLASYFAGGTTLQATTLAQSAWEQVGRTMDDELGVAYFQPTLPSATWQPVLTWFGRQVWGSPPQMGNTINIGCAPPDDPAPANWFDIAVDAEPASFDALLHNAVHASRSGGALQFASVQSSIDRFGQQDLQRNDLGLNDDAQVLTWAQFIVNKSSFPQTVLDQITVEPAIDAVRYEIEPGRQLPNVVWLQVLRASYPMMSRNRVRFDSGYVVDLQFRVVGWSHKITADRWEITWHTAPYNIVPTTASFHMGPHANDRLNAGFLMGG